MEDSRRHDWVLVGRETAYGSIVTGVPAGTRFAAEFAACSYKCETIDMKPRITRLISSPSPSLKAAVLALLGASLLSVDVEAAMALAPQAKKQTAKGTVTVKSTFQKLDADKDGTVTLKEASRWKIPTAAFRRHDIDQSKGLSADEFVVLYKDLLVQAGRPVASDLAAEVARIQARRRVKATKKVQEKAPAEAPAVTPQKAVSATPQKVALKAPQKGAPQKGRPESQPKSQPKNPSVAPARTPVAGSQAASSGVADAASPEETEKRVQEARTKAAADSAEARTKAARVKAAESAEARTKAARIKAAESAEARTKAARLKAEAQAEARIREARIERAMSSAEARTKAAREKAAAEARQNAAREKAAKDKKGTPPVQKPVPVPGKSKAKEEAREGSKRDRSTVSRRSTSR